MSVITPEGGKETPACPPLPDTTTGCPLSTASSSSKLLTSPALGGQPPSAVVTAETLVAAALAAAVAWAAAAAREGAPAAAAQRVDGVVSTRRCVDWRGEVRTVVATTAVAVPDALVAATTTASAAAASTTSSSSSLFPRDSESRRPCRDGGSASAVGARDQTMDWVRGRATRLGGQLGGGE